MFSHQDNESEKAKKIEELHYEEKKKTWKNEINDHYPNIWEVYDAFKSDRDAFLFICTIIIPEDIIQSTPKVIKTYFFGKSIPYLEPITKEAGDIGKLRDNWKNLETELKDLNKIRQRGRYSCRWLHRDKPILPKDLNKIREHGRDFYTWLLGEKSILPNNLSNARSEMGGIWIFCAANEVEPIWEWICPKTNDGEFWGDEFCIVRIHDDCNIVENCQVKKELIILGEGGSRHSPHKQLGSMCKNKVSNSIVFVNKNTALPLGKTSPESIRNCVICNMIEIDATVKTIFEGNIFNNNILLLHPCRQMLSKQSPIMWVDSRFDIPKEQAMYFVKCFCEVLGEHSINSEKVRVAKIVTETREKMKNGSNISGLWRLAFVVNGNPKTTLT